MKIKWKQLLLCILIPLLGGSIVAMFSMNSMEVFDSLNKPMFTPPGWVFPVVWTILYVMMGIASYLIINANASQMDVKKAIKLYAIQLLFNFIWPILFFRCNLYFIAFLWLVILWFLILLTIIVFSRISKIAAYLMIPYLLWVTFAGYLNLAIFIMML